MFSFLRVHNLFIPAVDSDDHFLKLYLLIDFINVLEKKGSVGKFVSSKETLEKFNSFGYRINIIRSAIVELLKLGILDTDDQLTDIDWQKLPDEINICITSKGYYYYKELLPRFYYLDLVVQDTPIFEKTYFEAIKLAFPLSSDKGKRLLYDRVETVKKFLKYLKSREELQPKQLQISYGRIVEHLFQGFNKDIENIKEEMNPTLFNGDA